MPLPLPGFLCDPALPEGRRAIMAAALGLFAQRGEAGTTVRDLAARAGVSGPALYKHFPSKEALAATLQRESALWLEETLGRPIEREAWFLDRMDRLVEGFCTLVDEVPDLFAFLSSGVGAPEGSGPDPFARMVERVLEKGRQERKLATDPPFEILAAATGGTLRETARRLRSGALEGPACLRAPDLLRALRRTLLP